MFREAVDILQSTPDSYDLDIARALRDLGGHLQDAGKQPEAAPVLNKACKIFDLQASTGAVRAELRVAF
jgi:hypothetical protein